jgi:alpha-glucosidase
VQSTSETPKGPLELDVYPGDDCRGEIYLDDGISIEGPSLRQEVRCAVTPTGVSLSFSNRQGAYRPWWKQIEVRVHGPKPGHMIIADQPRASTIAIR